MLHSHVLLPLPLPSATLTNSPTLYEALGRFLAPFRNRRPRGKLPFGQEPLGLPGSPVDHSIRQFAPRRWNVPHGVADLAHQSS